MSDQNSDNSKPPMNQHTSFFEDIGDTGRNSVISTVGNLAKIAEKAHIMTEKRQRLEDRLSDVLAKIDELNNECARMPGFADSLAVKERYAELFKQRDQIENELNKIQTLANVRTQTELSNNLSRKLSDSGVNVSVRGYQQSRGVQNMALAYSGKSNTDLNRLLSQTREELTQYGETAQSITKLALDDKGNLTEKSQQGVTGELTKREAAIKKMAVLERALSLKKERGEDEPTSMSQLLEMDLKARRALGKIGAANTSEYTGATISTTGADGMTRQERVTSQDLQKELIKQMTKLTHSMDELNTDLDNKSPAKIEEQRQAAEQASENAKKIQDAIDKNRDVDAERSSMWLGKARTLSNVGTGFGIISGTAQDLLIDQRMREMQNVGGWADIANEKYSTYERAAHGDVAARRSYYAYAQAKRFGDELRRSLETVNSTKQTQNKLQMLSGAATMGAAGVDAVIKTATLQGSGQSVELFQQGALNAIAGGGAALSLGEDISKSISGQEVQRAGIAAYMNNFNKVTQIDSKQQQRLEDFYRGLNTVSQGMGIRRSNRFINQSNTEQNMNRMLNANISPDQYLSYAHMADKGLGAMFDTSGDQIFRFAELQKVGLGSIEQNTSRAAMLAQSGAQNPTARLENIIAAGMTKGLNDSKSIDALVQNTASMIQGSNAAAFGIDTSRVTGGMLAATINSDVAKLNPYAAIADAISASELTKRITTDTSQTWTGQRNLAKLQDETNLSDAETLVAEHIEIPTLKTLQKDPAGARRYLRNRGIYNEDPELISKMIKHKAGMIAHSGLIGTNRANSSDEIVDIAREEIERSTKEGRPADVSRFMEELEKRGLAQSFNLSASGTDARGNYPGGGKQKGLQMFAAMDPRIGTEQFDINGIQNNKTNLDEASRTGFRQETAQMISAMQTLGGAGAALKTMIQELKKLTTGDVKNENTFATSAANLSRSMADSTQAFGNSVQTFARTVSTQNELMNRMATFAGLKSTGYPQTVIEEKVRAHAQEALDSFKDLEKFKIKTDATTSPGKNTMK